MHLQRCLQKQFEQHVKLNIEKGESAHGPVTKHTFRSRSEAEFVTCYDAMEDQCQCYLHQTQEDEQEQPSLAWQLPFVHFLTKFKI